MEPKLLEEAEKQRKVIISAGSALQIRNRQFLFCFCPPQIGLKPVPVSEKSF
jgi:hypothetical protein